MIINRHSNTSESIKLLKHKDRSQQYRHITRSEARQAQTKRSNRAKLKDMNEQNKKIVKDERWIYDPAHFDFPEVIRRVRVDFKIKVEQRADLSVTLRNHPRRKRNPHSELPFFVAFYDLDRVNL